MSWNSERMWVMLSRAGSPASSRVRRASTRESSVSRRASSPGSYHRGDRTRAWPKGEAGSILAMTQL